MWVQTATLREEITLLALGRRGTTQKSGPAAVTSLTIEQLGLPSSARRMRALDAARARAADELGGRTVWCATALPARRGAAQRLRASLEWGGGVVTGLLEVA